MTTPPSPRSTTTTSRIPEKFLLAGGFRGRQYQVLVEGTYFINRLFATVELIDKTIIDVGYVGVVVSYIGPKGVDSSGEDYKHGELVEQGFRGVWSVPLMPGKYAFNTYAGKVIRVPTTNIILKWISNQSGAHRYDENLKEVSLITKDAFEPSLPLSVVMHIDYKKAPLVIQRFGDIKLLVDQTLDPMVSAYFKNIGQTKTLIQLIQERYEIQAIASSEMTGQVRALQPGTGGGADRHARRPRPTTTRSRSSWPSSATGRSPWSRWRPTCASSARRNRRKCSRKPRPGRRSRRA